MFWTMLSLAVLALAFRSSPLLANSTGSNHRASQAEMRFGAQYLQIFGVLLVSLGMVNCLKVSGLAHQAASSGLPQCCGGALLGLFLSVLGDKLTARGQRREGLVMLAAGNGLLVLVLSAAHFYWRWLELPGLSAGIFLVAVNSGRAALRWNSAALAAMLLAALFIGPALMNFSVANQTVLLGYLLAVNLAATVLAYQRRWDAFLVATFAGTHLLYLTHFPLNLGFLALTYGLFLLASNGFPLLRAGAGASHLWLALANPLVFACLCYMPLSLGSNLQALALNAATGAIHLAIAALAHRRDVPMAQTNLSLGLLFGMASISFLPYFQNDASWFAAPAFAWLALAASLLAWSRRSPVEYGLLLRRLSYFAATLACLQLSFVVPLMDSARLMEAVAVIALALLFVFHERDAVSSEEWWFSNLLAMEILCLLSYLPGTPREMLLAGAVLAPGLLVVYQRYPLTLPWLGTLGLLLGAFVCVLALHVPWAADASAWVLFLLPLPLSRLTPLARRREDTQRFAPGGTAMTLLLCLRAALLFSPGAAGTLLWCLLGLALIGSSELADIAGVVLCCAFVKTIAFDADFVLGGSGVEVAGIGSLTGMDVLVATLIVTCFALASRRVRQLAWRPPLELFAMLTIVFQVSRLLYAMFGTLDNYQVVLSAFWTASSLGFIAAGAYVQNKLSRLFGLTLLGGSVAKMYTVDIWVLNAYDQSTTTIAVGVSLLLVSFVYQLKRAELEEPAVLEDEPRSGRRKCPREL